MPTTRARATPPGRTTCPTAWSGPTGTSPRIADWRRRSARSWSTCARWMKRRARRGAASSALLALAEAVADEPRHGDDRLAFIRAAHFDGDLRAHARGEHEQRDEAPAVRASPVDDERHARLIPRADGDDLRRGARMQAEAVDDLHDTGFHAGSWMRTSDACGGREVRAAPFKPR